MKKKKSVVTLFIEFNFTNLVSAYSVKMDLSEIR